MECTGRSRSRVPGGGRKPPGVTADAEEQGLVRIKVSLDAEALAYVEQAANAAGQSISAWAGEVLVPAARRQLARGK